MADRDDVFVAPKLISPLARHAFSLIFSSRACDHGEPTFVLAVSPLAYNAYSSSLQSIACILFDSKTKSQDDCNSESGVFFRQCADDE